MTNRDVGKITLSRKQRIVAQEVTSSTSPVMRITTSVAPERGADAGLRPGARAVTGADLGGIGALCPREDVTGVQSVVSGVTETSVMSVIGDRPTHKGPRIRVEDTRPRAVKGALTTRR